MISHKMKYWYTHVYTIPFSGIAVPVEGYNPVKDLVVSKIPLFHGKNLGTIKVSKLSGTLRFHV